MMKIVSHGDNHGDIRQSS